MRAPVPAWFRCERFAPLERLLPDAAAIVHHGGIGTCALALHHAVPQLIVPRFFGQPINAELMRRLGVAQVLAPENFTPPAVSARIEDLLRQPAWRERAARLRSQLHPAHELAQLVAFIEDHARQSARRPAHVLTPTTS